MTITDFDKTLDNTQIITINYEENGLTISGELTLNTKSKEIADMSSLNTLVEEALAAIVEDLDITKQAEVDAMADKIANALADLKEIEVPEPSEEDKPLPDTDEEENDPLPDTDKEKPEESTSPEEDDTDEEVNTSDVTPIFGFIVILVLAAVSFLFTRKEL